MTESTAIKEALEKQNKVYRLQLKLKEVGLENMTVEEIKELDPVLLEEAKNVEYRQILKNSGVVYLGF